MTKKHDPQLEKVAAAGFYAAVSQPLDAREVAEGADERSEVLRDAAAEKLRWRGMSARDAAMAVDVVRAVLCEADAQAAELMRGVAGGAAQTWVREDVMEALRVMAVKLVQAPKPRFSAGCFLLAAGIDYPGIRSQRDWAEQQHMSHEQASNEVLEWQRDMRLPATSGQKSEAARKTYKDTNGARKKGEL